MATPFDAMLREPPPSNVVVDTYVDLTGKTTLGITFMGCILHLDDRPGVVSTVSFCTFDDCDFTGNGWPPSIRSFTLRPRNNPKA